MLTLRKILFVVSCLCLWMSADAVAGVYELKSPDGLLSIEVSDEPAVRYSVRLNSRLLTGPNPLPIKNSTIENICNELTLTFEGSFAVVFRAYNDGVAYRFVTSIREPITVASEEIEYRFDKNHNVYFPAEDSMYTHQERQYKYGPLESVGKEQFCSLPMVVDVGDGVKLAISESDLSDYPGFYLSGPGRPVAYSNFSGCRGQRAADL